MKSEIFIHYGYRLKNTLKVYLKQTKLLIEKSKQYLINYLEVSTYYCVEISVQTKVFRNNFKYRNRFKNE